MAGESDQQNRVVSGPGKGKEFSFGSRLTFGGLAVLTAFTVAACSKNSNPTELPVTPTPVTTPMPTPTRVSVEFVSTEVPTATTVPEPTVTPEKEARVLSQVDLERLAEKADQERNSNTSQFIFEQLLRANPIAPLNEQRVGAFHVRYMNVADGVIDVFPKGTLKAWYDNFWFSDETPNKGMNIWGIPKQVEYIGEGEDRIIRVYFEIDGEDVYYEVDAALAGIFRQQDNQGPKGYGWGFPDDPADVGELSLLYLYQNETNVFGPFECLVFPTTMEVSPELILKDKGFYINPKNIDKLYVTETSFFDSLREIYALALDASKMGDDYDRLRTVLMHINHFIDVDDQGRPIFGIDPKIVTQLDPSIDFDDIFRDLSDTPAFEHVRSRHEGRLDWSNAREIRMYLELAVSNAKTDDARNTALSDLNVYERIYDEVLRRLLGNPFSLSFQEGEYGWSFPKF